MMKTRTAGKMSFFSALITCCRATCDDSLRLAYASGTRTRCRIATCYWYPPFLAGLRRTIRVMTCLTAFEAGVAARSDGLARTCRWSLISRVVPLEIFALCALGIWTSPKGLSLVWTVFRDGSVHRRKSALAATGRISGCMLQTTIGIH